MHLSIRFTIWELLFATGYCAGVVYLLRDPFESRLQALFGIILALFGIAAVLRRIFGDGDIRFASVKGGLFFGLCLLIVFWAVVLVFVTAFTR